MGILNIILILLSSYVLTNMESEDKVRYFITVGAICVIIILPNLIKLIAKGV